MFGSIQTTGDDGLTRGNQFHRELITIRIDVGIFGIFVGQNRRRSKGIVYSDDWKITNIRYAHAVVEYISEYSHTNTQTQTHAQKIIADVDLSHHTCMRVLVVFIISTVSSQLMSDTH